MPGGGHSARRSLGRSGPGRVRDHLHAMRDCIADPDGINRADDITTEELEKLFLTLA